MADTMTLEQVLLDMADCQGNRGVGHTYSRLTSWRLAIAAAIKQRERDKRDAARYRWLRLRLLVTEVESMSNVSRKHWAVQTAGDSEYIADLDETLDAAMAEESGNG